MSKGQRGGDSPPLHHLPHANHMPLNLNGYIISMRLSVQGVEGIKSPTSAHFFFLKSLSNSRSQNWSYLAKHFRSMVSQVRVLNFTYISFFEKNTHIRQNHKLSYTSAQLSIHNTCTKNLSKLPTNSAPSKRANNSVATGGLVSLLNDWFSTD